jgi:1,4-alpha-glucan branching enzyme
MIHKRSTTEGNKVLVTFEIPGSVWAEQVHLVGDFNEWDPHSLPFRHTREGKWQVAVELDRGREYRFRYLMDGQSWRNDWHADRYATGDDGASDSIVVAELLAPV